MNYMIGIEREGIRIFPDGRMADTPHPPEFGDKLMSLMSLELFLPTRWEKWALTLHIVLKA